MNEAAAAGAEFTSLALGPASVARITAAGILHAAAILASVALGAALARRRDLVPRLIVETHAIAVPVAILLARSRAFIDAFPAVLHDASLLARIATATPSPLPALAGVAALLVLMAWASGRPRALADCMAPGGLLIACGLLLDLTNAWGAPNAVTVAVAVLGCPTAFRLARRGERPGEAALVAGEGVVLALAATFSGGPIPSLGLVGCAIVLGLLLMTHVLLRARSR